MERAQKLNPDDVLLARVVAGLYRQYPQVVREEYPELTEEIRQARADDSMNRLVHDSPDNALAFLARHQYRVEYNIAGAEEDLAEALRLNPDDSKVRITAAAHAFEQARRKRTLPFEPG